MEKRDIYIRYATKDKIIAQQLSKYLESCGIQVYYDDGSLFPDQKSYYGKLPLIIRSVKLFLVILTPNSIGSYIIQEIELAGSISKNYAKTIIPICFSPNNIIEDLPDNLKYVLSSYQILTADEASPNNIEKIATQIAELLQTQNNVNILYDKLSEYIKIDACDDAVRVLCELIQITSQKLSNISDPNKLRNLWREIYYCAEKLPQLYHYDYGEEARELAHIKLSAIDEIRRLLKHISSETDLFYISLSIRLIYLDRLIRLDCADAITGGDVSQGIVHTLPEDNYAEEQKQYAKIYYTEIENQKISENNKGIYSEEEIQFVFSTPDYIYKQIEKTERKSDISLSSQEDELLKSIASFMREGNRVFELIGKQYYAEEFLRCLLTSYERLKSYCELIGEKEICVDCIDRISEVRQRLVSASSDENLPSPKTNAGFRTILGLTIPKSGNFDVFISYKHEDGDLAAKLYQYFKRNMKEVFFDKISLPEMSEAEYEDAIMNALDNSKHFIVVLSDLKYLESKWVTLEMKTFKSEINEGRKTDSNFIIVVTNDVYDQIISSNKKVLPIQYRRSEIVRFENYEKVLLSYVSKK